MLVVDDFALIDPVSRRLLENARPVGSILRVVDSPDALRLPPLPVESLGGLFHGPDRVFHLREDAAAELHRRTGGIPARVAAELDAWVAARLARWDAGHIRLDRLALDRLCAGLELGARPSPQEGGGAAVEGHLGQLLAWLALATAPMDVSALAAASERPGWEVALELDELTRLGAVRCSPDGLFEPLFSPLSSAVLDPAKQRRRHEALAAAFAVGHPARLKHLIAAELAAEAAIEAHVQGLALAERGLDAQAVNLVAETLTALGGTLDPAHVEALLVALAGHARLSGTPGHGAQAAALIRSLQLDALAPIATLLDAIRLAETGRGLDAWVLAKTLAPFADTAVEERRLAIRVQAAVETDHEPVGPLLDAAAASGATSARCLASWRGLAAYHRGDFPEAWRLQVEAMSLAPNATARLDAQVNAAVAASEGPYPESGRKLVASLIREGASMRRARTEAWGIGLERTLDYRAGKSMEPDPEWVELSAAIGPERRHVAALCQEAAIAWRAGCAREAMAWAGQSAALGAAAGGAENAVLARALWHSFGGVRPKKSEPRWVWLCKRGIDALPSRLCTCCAGPSVPALRWTRRSPRSRRRCWPAADRCASRC